MREVEAGLSDNEPMIEGALRQLAARIDLESNRADLHVDDGLVTRRRCRHKEPAIFSTRLRSNEPTGSGSVNSSSTSSALVSFMDSKSSSLNNPWSAK